jgi:hypothetical protein
MSLLWLLIRSDNQGTIRAREEWRGGNANGRDRERERERWTTVLELTISRRTTTVGNRYSFCRVGTFVDGTRVGIAGASTSSRLAT